MQAAASAVGLAFFTCFSPAAHAGIVSFTSKSDFEAALDPGAYTEPQMYSKYPNYAGSGFSYTASAEGGGYPVEGDLSTSGAQGTIAFNFGSGINAFGGYFYNTNLNTTLNTLPLAFSFDSGVFVTTGSSPSSTTFYGFISDTDFANAVISSGQFPVAGTVIVGSSTPPTPAVPGPLPLFGAGAAFGLSRRLRRRRAAGLSDS